MKSVEEFLAYAIKIEEEAVLRFGQLADAMETYGNKEAGAFFRRMSDYSRMHLNAARERSGFREIPDMEAGDFQWPDLESPETAAIWAADPFIAKREALEIALNSEKAGYAFYKRVHDTTEDPEIKALAAEFHIEEAQHVLWIEGWLAEDEAEHPTAQPGASRKAQ